MNQNQLNTQLAQMRVKITQLVHHGLPLLIGAKIVSLTKDNFQREGFFGQKWQDVKRRTDPKRFNKHHPTDAKRKILTGRTADLGRSIQYRTEDGGVTIFSDKVYSAVHNYGGRAGAGLRVVIPKRQFLGHHNLIDQEVQNIIKNEINKITNKQP